MLTDRARNSRGAHHFFQAHHQQLQQEKQDPVKHCQKNIYIYYLCSYFEINFCDIAIYQQQKKNNVPHNQ